MLKKSKKRVFETITRQIKMLRVLQKIDNKKIKKVKNQKNCQKNRKSSHLRMFKILII